MIDLSLHQGTGAGDGSKLKVSQLGDALFCKERSGDGAGEPLTLQRESHRGRGERCRLGSA